MGAQLSAGRSTLVGEAAAAWIEEPIHFEPARPTLAFRTIWVSDTHLGTSGCQAELLLDFLKSTECEAFRGYVGLNLGGIELLPEALHETADGRRLLILHGDEFDGVVLYARWLAFLGDHAYTLLLKLNGLLNGIRKARGLPYWSLSAQIKKRVKNAVQFISSFEQAVAHAAVERGADGVVCGHIHSAEIRAIGDVTYYNDGDWVESCTALVEHADGRMEIVDWAEHKRLLAAASAEAPITANAAA